MLKHLFTDMRPRFRKSGIFHAKWTIIIGLIAFGLSPLVWLLTRNLIRTPIDLPPDAVTGVQPPPIVPDASFANNAALGAAAVVFVLGIMHVLTGVIAIRLAMWQEEESLIDSMTE